MINDIFELKLPTYATISEATCGINDMDEMTVSTKMQINGNITPDFSEDWEILFKGHKYIMPLRTPAMTIQESSLDSEYDFTFEHWAIYQLKSRMFFEYSSVETGTAIPDKWVVPLRLNLKNFCVYLSRVCEYWYSDKITVDLNPAWIGKDEPTAIDISYSFVWAVLKKIFEAYGVRWYLAPNGSPDRYVIKIGYPAEEVTHIFEHGFEGGLLKIERQIQSSDIRNMLLGRGGEKNLPQRYFKDVDPQNPTFKADPDWIPELRNIYFDRLLGKTFRDYVKGWKTNPQRQLTEEDGTPIKPYGSNIPISVEPYDEEYAQTSYAYMRGHSDEKFNPIEYVRDADSIARYGERLGSAGDDDDVFPTIQGTGQDIAIDVEQVMDDDVEQAVTNDTVVSDLKIFSQSIDVVRNERASLTLTSEDFRIEAGKAGNIDEGVKTFKVTTQSGKTYNFVSRVLLNNAAQSFEVKDGENGIVLEDARLYVIDRTTGETLSASGIPAGSYYLEIKLTIHNTLTQNITVTASCESAKLTSATPDTQWAQAFNLWIGNVWSDTRQDNETDIQFAERVWQPILGDRLGNEAKVIFTTGELAASEDYEFKIVKIPEYDTSKVFSISTESPGNPAKITRSWWKLTLAKSDADLESLGKYVPNKERNGHAGDRFAFIGIDMQHQYVLWAEQELDNRKNDKLKEVSEIQPSCVVTTDRVRLNNYGRPGAIIDRLHIGNSVTLFDKRLFGGSHQQKFYIKSLTYTYRKPTSDDAALNPDLDMVLSDKYEVSASPLSTMSAEISAISRQLGSVSNLEQLIRAVCDTLYLRKDGFSDRSMSPTEFASLISSYGFRNGIVGGKGWGFFRDENGNWVFETDKVNVRQEMQVNSLVINQAQGRGGMTIDSAAVMEVSYVENTGNGYKCYFDQKDGSVANLFKKGDVAYCNRWTAKYAALKFYKRRVTEVGANYIVLAKAGQIVPVDWPDNGVNGSGVPEEKDVIIHFGSYTDPERQYIKVSDVVGGGYERYITELNSVNAQGREYFFVGSLNGLLRLFVGDTASDFLQWTPQNGLQLRGTLTIDSKIGDKTIEEFIGDSVDAKTPYTLKLSQDTLGVGCDDDGNFTDPATVYVSVYKGTHLLQGWDITAESTDAEVSVSGNAVTITDITTSQVNGTIEIKAIKAGEGILTANLGFFKIIPGSDGVSPTIYTFETSDSVITRNFDASLQPTSITVTKYQQQAQARSETTSNTLKATFYYLKANSQTQTVSAHESGNSATITIPQDLDRMVLTLYEGNTDNVLYRTTIPVLANSSDIEIGGTNLLLNSAFNKKLDSWTADTDFVSVDNSIRLDDCRSVRIKSEGATENKYRGISQTYEPVSFQQWLSGGIWFRTNSIINIDEGAQLELQFLDKNDNPLSSKGINLVCMQTRVWYYAHFSAIAPANTAKVKFFAWVRRNGTLWLAKPKLEFGNIPTQWSPSPLDIDYITEVLKQDRTKITGALIQTGQIRLGQTQPDGTHKTMAGSNGVYENERTLTIWGGGDMVDAEEDPENGATFAVRMDGSVYAAKNTVRFGERNMRIGENLLLDEDGLTLLDNGAERLRVVNKSIADFLSAGEVQNISVSGTPWYRYGIMEGVSNNYIVITQSMTFEKSITLKPNTSVDANITFSLPGLPTIDAENRPFLIQTTVNVSLLDSNSKVLSSERYPILGSVENLTVKNLNLHKFVSEAGTYRIAVTMMSGSTVQSEAIMQAQIGGEITAKQQFDNSNILGNDGIVSHWGNATLKSSAEGCVMQFGQFVFSVDIHGIRGSKDNGQTWTQLIQ